MGREFGKGLTVRPISKMLYLGISPMEQKAYYKLPFANWFRRFKSKALFGTPVIAYTIWMMGWCDRRAIECNRKQPGEFDHET